MLCEPLKILIFLIIFLDFSPKKKNPKNVGFFQVFSGVIWMFQEFSRVKKRLKRSEYDWKRIETVQEH